MSQRATGRFRAVVSWLPALPLIVVVGSVLLAPVAVVAWRSVHDADGNLSLYLWQRVFSRPADVRAIRTSLLLGCVTATIALIVGTPVAIALSSMSAARRLAWVSLLNIAARLSGVGVAFAYMALLGLYGMVTLLLQQLGWQVTPPRSDSLLGVVLAITYLMTPLFILLTWPAMRVLRPELREAATVSAASGLQFWRLVGGPMIAPFLLSGWLIVFAATIGTYGLVFALAGQSGSSQLRLMTLQIGIALNAGGTAESVLRGSVHSVLLVLFAMGALVVSRLVVRRAAPWQR